MYYTINCISSVERNSHTIKGFSEVKTKFLSEFKYFEVVIYFVCLRDVANCRKWCFP